MPHRGVDDSLSLWPDNVTPQPTRAAARNWVIALKLALLLVVLGFVGWALYRNFQQIDFSAVRFSVAPAALAVVFLVVVSTVQMVSYRSLLSAYTQAPAWRVMAAVAWVPPLGKYVPGKVAALLGAIYMLRRFNIPAAVAISVVLVLDGLAVIAGLITGSPLLLWEPVQRVLPGGWVYCGIIVAAGIVCLHPAVFGRAINFALKKLKKPPLPRMPDVARYIVPVMCAFAQWIAAGLALWFMTRSVAEMPASQIPLFISIAALAMTISYLALFAPAGLGVREAIYLGTLASLIGPKAAIVVAAMRVAQTLVELGLAGVGMVLLRGASKPPVEQIT
ncbi:MAG TPA: hypothetical protein PLD59_17615 [Tepidisphaeraceae bacterium]|nr:hypothetical protein [Tepidisphaeraceae bacterium]